MALFCDGIKITLHNTIAKTTIATAPPAVTKKRSTLYMYIDQVMAQHPSSTAITAIIMTDLFAYRFPS